jgi:hypothetical protein
VRVGPDALSDALPESQAAEHDCPDCAECSVRVALYPPIIMQTNLHL